MDAAHRVIDRLGRIERMKAYDAPVGELLEELRCLLEDGRAWLASEGSAGTNRAAAALGRLDTALGPEEPGGPLGGGGGGERTA